MRLIVSLLILSFVLVACGGDAEPTASVSSDPTQTGVSSDPTHTPSADGEVDNGIVIVTPQTNIEQDQLPLPGTLTYDDEFSDDTADAMFDRIVFRRYAGPTDSPNYRLELYQDGTYELNIETLGQTDAETVARIDNIIRDVNFFAINSPMMGPGDDSQNYRYSITVERAGDEMTINAEDGFIPQEFSPLIGALMSVIVNSGI